MKKLKRTAALVLSALMALTLTACGARSQVEEQQAFDAFMHEQFVAAMQDDYLTAHVFLENPQDFGVDTSQMVVRINEGISAENTRENVRQMQRTREELQRFEREKLTAEQQDTYDLYLYQLDLGIESGADRFMYYGTLLEPMTGVHAQIPTLLADLQLRDEEDVQNLPELVKSVGPLFDSIIAFTREQADAGLLMLNIDEVSAYCKELVGKGEQGATLSAMQRNVDAAGFLSPQAKQAYKQQIAQAYTQAFLPAYQRLYEAVEALRGKPNNALGLAQFSDGKAYYELLFKYKTGSSRSIEEVKQQFSQMQRARCKRSSACCCSTRQRWMHSWITRRRTGRLTTCSRRWRRLQRGISRALPTSHMRSSRWTAIWRWRVLRRTSTCRPLTARPTGRFASTPAAMRRAWTAWMSLAPWRMKGSRGTCFRPPMRMKS